jgi:hypothetical protein
MKPQQCVTRTTGVGRCGRSGFAAPRRAMGRKLELSSHVLEELRSGLEEREIETGGTEEEPLDRAVSNLGVCVHRREGPPWLPLGRVEMKGVERAAVTPRVMTLLITFIKVLINDQICC